MHSDRPGYHLIDRPRMKAVKEIIAKGQHGQRRIVNTALRVSTRAINGGTDPYGIDVSEHRLIKPVSQIRRQIAEY